MAAAAANKPRGAVVFLHGSGGNGRDLLHGLRAAGFEEELKDMGLELHCPAAPPRPYSMLGGMRQTVWFDRIDLHPDAPEDAKGADVSYQLLRDLLAKLKAEKGIESGSVYLGGFSMGGGMSLMALARHPEPLAGVFGFGSFLATQTSVYGQLGAAARATPVLLGHGQSDSAVAYDWGLATARRLHVMLSAAAAPPSAPPPQVSFFGFPHLDHELDHRELALLLGWIRTGATEVPDAALLNQRFARHGGVVKEALGPAPAKDDLGMTVVGESGSGSTTVTLRVPEAAVPALLAHPIAARGAHFSSARGPEPGTVQTTFVSPRPQEVAETIRERVRARLRDPDGGRNGAEGVCPTS